jgi:hypothetical protein
MNPLPTLQDGDTCLFKTAGVVGEIVSWWENDTQGFDHVAKYIRGKLFSSLTKQGICFYDFTEIGLMSVRRPISFDVQKFDGWWPSVVGSPYGWGDIGADSGLADVPHILVPSPDIIHKTGADCSDTCAMADEMAGCPQFDPYFDKRRITPFYFCLSIGSKEIWKFLPETSFSAWN